jgi:hypothetical protein
MDEFNKAHKDFQFVESDGFNRVLFPTYLPDTPELRESLRLQEEIRKLVESFRSEEVNQLAREFGPVTHLLKEYEHGMKGSAKWDRNGLIATSKDLKRKLSALGAQQIIELQEKESDLNVRAAMERNRAKDKAFAETGLDWGILNRFLLPALLKFLVDFVIPVVTALYAIWCLLRGR